MYSVKLKHTGSQNCGTRGKIIPGSFVIICCFMFYVIECVFFKFIVLPSALDDEDGHVITAETASSDGAPSSWESYNSHESAPMAQMTQMLKVVKENLKEKMRVS